jgi:hypothetical protein
MLNLNQSFFLNLPLTTYFCIFWKCVASLFGTICYVILLKLSFVIFVELLSTIKFGFTYIAELILSVF